MSAASSLDPTAEIAAIRARLSSLTDGLTYFGVPMGRELPVDEWGNKRPYRDLEVGGPTPSAQGRMVAAGEQAQPHVWSFQIHHYATTREALSALCAASDRALMGWAPSENATPIGTFFFTMYDEFNRSGERIGYVATRFYETTLGQNVDPHAEPSLT